ncbi:putative periplasmic protein [Rubellimicrobium thermophilum DSM 16684]|uniref:Putative periplasmic protein n=1 Tax=Rubellimicrobium thermophilum DSM 16684 TaxID=1123069 RepID=S9RWZ2_9RHOB|nr:phosphodiester glycosidase family protein [Rubellimicrobium thermophilum]EPX82535.1 putative periplasmic protein [Rubellimicrobium thermophilum DSM 16684]
MTRGLAGAFALAVLAGPAAAVTCRDIRFEDMPYTICEAAPRQERIRLFLNDADGRPFGSFAAIEAARGPLAFAMNAGMYHADRSPVGLYVEDGEEIRSLVPGPGPGNFGMVPNGVFCIAPEGAFVIETEAYAAAPRHCDFATQSGPMLLIDGSIHPRFLPDSDSRNIRNGVGTSSDGSRAVFAMSRRPVTFWEFARLFRDGLGLPDALYLDGRVSRLHAPAIGRSDGGVPMGPIVGILAQEALPPAP